MYTANGRNSASTCASIRPVPKAKVDVSNTDPDDVAYIDTIEEIAARAIYTRDRDFLRTTAPVILVAIDTTLQQYARASTVRIGIVMGSSVSIAFGLEALLALGRLLSRLVQAARRLPPAAQVLVVGSVAAAIAHPKSRAKLLQAWNSLNESLTPAVWEAVVQGVDQFVQATSTAEESFQAIREILPPSRRHPLLFYARSACLAARKPLVLDEIVIRVIADDYRRHSSL
jgi:hypothetical protein